MSQYDRQLQLILSPCYPCDLATGTARGPHEAVTSYPSQKHCRPLTLNKKIPSMNGTAISLNALTEQQA